MRKDIRNFIYQCLVAVTLITCVVGGLGTIVTTFLCAADEFHDSWVMVIPFLYVLLTSLSCSSLAIFVKAANSYLDGKGE